MRTSSLGSIYCILYDHLSDIDSIRLNTFDASRTPETATPTCSPMGFLTDLFLLLTAEQCVHDTNQPDLTHSDLLKSIWILDRSRELLALAHCTSGKGYMRLVYHGLASSSRTPSACSGFQQTLDLLVPGKPATRNLTVMQHPTNHVVTPERTQGTKVVVRNRVSEGKEVVCWNHGGVSQKLNPAQRILAKVRPMTENRPPNPLVTARATMCECTLQMLEALKILMFSRIHSGQTCLYVAAPHFNSYWSFGVVEND